AEDGIKIPHLVRKSESSVMKLKAVKFNVPLADSLFAKPAGTAPAIGPDGGPAMATSLNPGSQPGIVRRPPPAVFEKEPLSVLPKYNPSSPNPFQVDLRGADLTKLDVGSRSSDLFHADFDSKTRWPGSLPQGFAPHEIMESGKNPGLRLGELHRRGITGKGVGLAIIDQTLLVDHTEYKDRLRSYEEIHSPADASAQMHGPAVASIAVGKTCGVAPEADLYYIAEIHGTVDHGKFNWDFTWLAQSIDRILELNRALPKDHKIRVISISVGWSGDQKGSVEADAAVQRAKEAGVFVISTALERTHHLRFHGLGRDSTRNPDDYGSYGLGSWWAEMFKNGQQRFGPGERLLVPMDSRTTASPTGSSDYVFYSNGGWSWCVPYIAGLYALACQVNPDITPDEFWSAALKTGRTTTIDGGGKPVELGTIVDPVALMDALRRGS
ncbi:MAG: S8 family serine peptidase, partial [Limisphaerales bacterium]